MLPELKRFTDRLLHHRREASSATAAPKSSAPGDFHYHCGDHWQNLLASPMDARHYVLEDWSAAVAAFEPAEPPFSESRTRAETYSMRRRQA